MCMSIYVCWVVCACMIVHRNGTTCVSVCSCIPQQAHVHGNAPAYSTCAAVLTLNVCVWFIFPFSLTLLLIVLSRWWAAMPQRELSSCLTTRGGRDSTWVRHTSLHHTCWHNTLSVCVCVCVCLVAHACSGSTCVQIPYPYHVRQFRLFLCVFPKLTVPYATMCLCMVEIDCCFLTELYENLGQVGASIKHHLVEGMRNMWQQLNEFARSHSSTYSIEKEQDTTGMQIL